MAERQRLQQEQAMRQYEAQMQAEQRRAQDQQQRAQEAQHRDLLNQRAGWCQNIERQPGSSKESIGNNAKALRDGKGNIRDIEYKNGDVRFRSFDYDDKDQPKRMIVDSKSKGTQIWNRTGENTWVDQVSGSRFNGTMQMDQESGVFKFRSSQDGVTRTYSPSGRAGLGENSGDDVQRDASRGAGRGERSGARPSQGKERADDAEAARPKKTIIDDGNGRDASLDKAIKNLYGPREGSAVSREITDRATYKENLWSAAEQRKPVVMTFIDSGKSPDGRVDAETKQALKEIHEAQKNAKGAAEFMIVDLAKVDPKSAVGKYAKDYIGVEPYRTPLTMVFNQSQGRLEAPVAPDAPMHYQMGDTANGRPASAEQRAQQLQAAIAEAAKIQLQPDHEIRLPNSRGDRLKENEEQRRLEVEKLSKDLIEQARQRNALEQFDPAKTMTGVERSKQYDAYRKAIESADKIQNPEVQKEMGGRLRVMLGLTCNQWGAGYHAEGSALARQAQQESKEGKAAEAATHKREASAKLESSYKNARSGVEWILQGTQVNPDLYRYNSFGKALQNSVMSPAASDMILNRGRQNSAWFETRDGKVSQQALDEVMLAKRAPQVPPIPEKQEKTNPTDPGFRNPFSEKQTGPFPKPVQLTPLQGQPKS